MDIQKHPTSHLTELRQGLPLTQSINGGRFRPHKGEVFMESLKAKFQKFLRDEEGATAVEYVVMVALIIAVAIVAISTLGEKVESTFTNVTTSMK